jgi:hypothetical protein
MTDAADSFALLLGPDVPIRDYKAGEAIFREGDRGDEFFVTVSPVTEKQYLFLVRHTPFFALKVMRVLAQRLRTQNKAL